MEVIEAKAAMLQLERNVDVFWQCDVESASSDAADQLLASGNDVNARFVLISDQLPTEARLQLYLRKDFISLMGREINVGIFRLQEKGRARGRLPTEAACFNRQFARRADEFERRQDAVQYPLHNSSKCSSTQR